MNWWISRGSLKGFESRMGGPVEVDDAAFGGREGNKHANRKLNAGRGTVGKSIVAGIKNRETNENRAKDSSSRYDESNARRLRRIKH